jgi:hypothetical protein
MFISNYGLPGVVDVDVGWASGVSVRLERRSRNEVTILGTHHDDQL